MDNETRAISYRAIHTVFPKLTIKIAVPFMGKITHKGKNIPSWDFILVRITFNCGWIAFCRLYDSYESNLLYYRFFIIDRLLKS